MEKHEKLICDFMFDFVDKNWDIIDFEKYKLTDSKKDFLIKVKNDIEEALWVLTEVCYWSMKDGKRHLTELFMNTENIDFHVIKIKQKYIKLRFNGRTWDTEFCNPKKKTVIYFE